MNSYLHIPLNATEEQAQKLIELQALFAEVCNALSPLVKQTRCWNRVTLHHLAYKALRQQFPAMGSQMVCNAIYSVSRSCRAILQHPDSPFNVSRQPERPIPLLRFAATAPVYFDRHTISIKDGLLSMYTLDGRMRFQLNLNQTDEARFHEEKLREIVLNRLPEGFRLSFWFSDAEDADKFCGQTGDLPDYILIQETDKTPLSAEQMPPPTGGNAWQLASRV